MSDDKDDLSNQETDALLASLNNRAASSDAPVEEEEEGGEDIEAFLADLEGDAEPAPAPQDKPAEPDPFADAWADLEGMHGDEVDAELDAKYAALEAAAKKEVAAKPKKPAPAPEPTPEPEPEPEKETALVAPPEANPKADEPEKEEAADKKSKKEDKKKKKNEPAIIESEQSPKVKFAFGVVKWSILLVPVFLSWWVIGSFLGQWLETGWMIAIVATLTAFILPLIPRLLTSKGRWAYWAFGFALLSLAGLIAPWPGTAGKRLAHYGHWPASTVAQLAKWQPDNAAVTMTAWGAEVIGNQLEELAPSATPKATDGEKAKGGEEKGSKARALGLETELEAHAEAQRVEQRKADEEAKETPSEDKKDAKKDEASEKDDAKEEKPEETKNEESK